MDVGDITTSLAIPNPKLSIDSSVTQTANMQGASSKGGVTFGNYYGDGTEDGGVLGELIGHTDPVVHYIIIGLIVAGVIYFVVKK